MKSRDIMKNTSMFVVKIRIFVTRHKYPILLGGVLILLLAGGWWWLGLPEPEPDPNFIPFEVDDSTVAYATIWVNPVAVKWTTSGYTYVHYANTYVTFKGHIDIIPGNVYKIVYKSYSIVSIEMID